jgi:hypothetical protein
MENASAGRSFPSNFGFWERLFQASRAGSALRGSSSWLDPIYEATSYPRMDDFYSEGE